MKTQKILGEENAKTTKGEKLKYKTAIIYMASHKQSGYNVCPQASKECSELCLFFSGFGGFKFTQNARIIKTKRYFEDRINFMNQLKHEIKLFINRSKKNGFIPCIRLNGTSDLQYENYKFDDGLNIFESFPDIQFYDYTVLDKKYTNFLNGDLPNNYYLTYSRKEDNQIQVLENLNNGGNVSVVFEKYLPKVYKGFKVINGDETDLRFLDQKNVVVGLKEKLTLNEDTGKLDRDNSGFVVDIK